VFVAFVLFHLAGNLKVYLGQEEFDGYALWLKHLFNPLFPGTAFLWLFRIALAAFLIIHVYSGLTIWVRARRARGPFARRGLGVHRISARTMIWTGLIVLCFIIFHLLDLTIGKGVESGHFSEALDANGLPNAYDNLVYSLQRPWVAAFYILTMLLLAIHVEHGVRTIVTDLGGTGRRLRATFAALAGVIVFLIVVGNLSIPIAILSHVVTPA
jgi:succinate dehydrogenase / fumarate reductase cytochrome b subunit